MLEQGIPSPTPDGSVTKFAPFLFGAALISFALLLYTVRDIAHPILVGAITAFLLYPTRREIYGRRFLWGVVIVTATWGLYDARLVLMPFVLAFFFAFLFDPLVTRFSTRVPRWATALLLLLLIFGAATAAGMFVVPPLVAQLDALLHSLSAMAHSFGTWFSQGGLSSVLTSLNIPQDRVQAFIAEQLSPRLQSALETILGAMLNFVSGASYAVGQIVNVIVVPFLGFYLLKDFPAIRSSVHRFLGAMHASRAASRGVTAIDEMISSYFRGQLLVAIVIGALATLIFVIAGLPYAYVLGVVIAVLDVIPFVGLIASLAISILVVLLGAEPSMSAVAFVVAVILSLHLLETYLISPRILGKRVGLHPVVIILSIFLFSHELGVLGVLIAVPSAAIGSYIIREWLKGVPQREFE